MVNERQVREMLKFCENRLGRRLDRLRESLLESEPSMGLWELLLLHSSLQVAKAEHEPGDAMPDIRYLGASRAIWIEATTVTHRNIAETKRLDALIEWIRMQLDVSGVLDGASMGIRYERIDDQLPCSLPRLHQFKSLKKLQSWIEFCKRAMEGEIDACWELSDHNLRFSLEGPSRYAGMVSSGGPVLFLPRHPHEHPVYRAIRSKSDQARRWEKRHGGGSPFQPLIIWIAAIGDLSQIDPANSYPNVTLSQAVNCALYDQDVMSIPEQYNFCGTWWKPEVDRVSGHHRIAAVCVTQFEQHQSGVYAPVRLKPKTEIFWDRTSRMLEAQIARSVQRIAVALEKIEYGPGWESWDLPRDRSGSLALERARRAGGSIGWSEGDRTMFIEVPVSVLALLLAGDSQVEDILKGYKGDWRKRLRRILEEGCEIIDVEYIKRTPGSREEPSVKLTFGDPVPPVLRVPKLDRN